MAALCVECGTRKVFERGFVRCSDCEAKLDNGLATADETPARADGAPPLGVSPGSLLGIGIAMQVIGGSVVGFTLNDAEKSAGFVLGAIIAWAGGLVLLVALIALGVKIGIESVHARQHS